MIITVCLCITALELYALHEGFDGRILLSVIATLSTIAGWQAKKHQIAKKGGPKCLTKFEK